ncbi:MAG TPA: glycosyltransferase family 1 protein [Acidimicrobiales bacterium]|nr:glycosyltransferase family 1 protein [Acidimicrobiales bacterium]
MAERLRVAIDATPLIGKPTGVGVFCAGVLDGLSRRGDVAAKAFAVSWRRRHAIDGRVPAGVAIAGRAMPARPLHLAWGRADQPPLEWFVGAADVVHGTNYVVPPTRRAARVMTVHDLTTVRYPELCNRATLAFPDLVRRALRRGAWVHTHTEAVAAEVVAVFGADPARVRAVASGVPPLADPDEGAPARYLPPGVTRYVLAVGTAEPRKDLPGLVSAFDVVAADRPDLGLVLAGPEGWGSAALHQAIDAARARSRVVSTGWVDDAALSGLVRRAAVLAYPSVYEGFGYPPLQAMAVGVPVVATRTDAIEEVLGDAALLVAARDTTALAEAIASVVDASTAAASLAERGRARAETFDWDRCAAGLVALYRDAAGG